MNKEIIHTHLQELLETIQEQYQTINTAEERIQQIEFDIILANVRELYEKIHLLQRMNDPFDQAGKTKTKEVSPSEPVKQTPKQEKKAPIRSDMDLFAEEPPAFNIKLKEAREKSLPPKPSPVEHLKTLIGINDKFIFINELFDGNLRDYNEAIETLNGFKEKNEALEFLDLLRKKNLWELESGTFMKLKELLEKKF